MEKTKENSDSLVVLLRAPNAKTLVHDFIYPVARNGCYFEESRFMALGESIGCIARISGNWNAIAKMEDALHTLKENTHLWLEFKRSPGLHLVGDYLPYLVQIAGQNKPNLINEIAHFFVEQGVQLLDLQSDAFKSTFSDTKLINLVLRLHVPADLNIAELRERFILLCEEMNVDGILEPEKSIK